MRSGYGAAASLGLWAAACLLPSRPAAAHEFLTAVVQHQIHLSVGARDIDLTIELTFFEEWSARERHAMDADGNGRITPTEVEAYVKKIAPNLAGQVTLRLAGRTLPLMPLYDPEVDLLGDERALPAHHVLRLFFFAATPPDLHVHDAFLVEDRLWPKAEALVTVSAGAKNGAAVETERPPTPDAEARTSDEPLCVEFRCLRPPHNHPS